MELTFRSHNQASRKHSSSLTYVDLRSSSWFSVKTLREDSTWRRYVKLVAGFTNSAGTSCTHYRLISARDNTFYTRTLVRRLRANSGNNNSNIISQKHTIISQEQACYSGKVYIVSVQGVNRAIISCEQNISRKVSHFVRIALTARTDRLY